MGRIAQFYAPMGVEGGRFVDRPKAEVVMLRKSAKNVQERRQRRQGMIKLPWERKNI